MLQNVAKCCKMLLNVVKKWKLSKFCQITPNCCRGCNKKQIVPYCCKMSQNVAEFSKMLQNVSNCSIKVQKLQYVARGWKMVKHVTKYCLSHNLLQNVAKC